MKQRICLSLDSNVVDKIDAKKGLAYRSTVVNDMLKNALELQDSRIESI